ncbi:MAG: hypothetical protein H6722_12650 [Sandaracinus sp.]|nr:hypothetical protein [Sandaracinus sp.]
MSVPSVKETPNVPPKVPMTLDLAYRFAGAAVRARYFDQRPGTHRALERLRASDVAVYSGNFDHVQELLTALSVPFTLDPKSLDAKVVFVNCASQYDPAFLKRLAAHVRAGARLVTSDWALSRVLQTHFPGTVAAGKGRSGDEVVAVEPAADSLWADVVVPGTDPQWWLESSSEPLQVLDESRVRVEARSHELLGKYGEPAVAVSFPWGDGDVFHVVSHFRVKRTRQHGRRHAERGTAFLREGLRLPESTIAELFATHRLEPDALDFATMQSTATSVELCARLAAGD